MDNPLVESVALNDETILPNTDAIVSGWGVTVFVSILFYAIFSWIALMLTGVFVYYNYWSIASVQ